MQRDAGRRLNGATAPGAEGEIAVTATFAIGVFIPVLFGKETSGQLEMFTAAVAEPA
jgi:hypothetical protein